MTDQEDVKQIGIYLGWRERSLPGILDYATMWWRKSAAEKAGDVDTPEIIEWLQRMYLRANALKHAPPETSVKPYMALVTMGLGSGGQVLLKSVAQPHEYELAERAADISEMSEPSRTTGKASVYKVIDSFGVRHRRHVQYFFAVHSLTALTNAVHSRYVQLGAFSVHSLPTHIILIGW